MFRDFQEFVTIFTDFLGFFFLFNTGFFGGEGIVYMKNKTSSKKNCSYEKINTSLAKEGGINIPRDPSP